MCESYIRLYLHYKKYKNRNLNFFFTFTFVSISLLVRTIELPVAEPGPPLADAASPSAFVPFQPAFRCLSGAVAAVEAAADAAAVAAAVVVAAEAWSSFAGLNGCTLQLAAAADDGVAGTTCVAAADDSDSSADFADPAWLAAAVAIAVHYFADAGLLPSVAVGNL